MKSDIEKRMRGYEAVSKTSLVKRMPVILRLDGRAFHTFTKGFERPFDGIMKETMQDTMKVLCEEIMGCVLGYTQSDEITLVLCDYQRNESQAWFDNEVQKMVSIASGIATLAFNNAFRDNVSDSMFDAAFRENVETRELISDTAYWDKKTERLKQGIMDCRAFNVPKEDVNNCLLWRQMDATRNSILSVAQANFPRKQIEGKNVNELQDMLFKEKGINWNDYPTYLKRGCCCIKTDVVMERNGKEFTRGKWVIDKEIPIFSQDPDYVNSRIQFD